MKTKNFMSGKNDQVPIAFKQEHFLGQDVANAVGQSFF